MKTIKRYAQQKAHLEGCMVEGYVMNEAFFFLCEFLSKDVEYQSHFLDDEWASYIIDGEKQQTNGVKVEISK